MPSFLSSPNVVMVASANIVKVIVGFVGLLYLRIPLVWVVIITLIAVPITLIGLIFFGKWHINKAAKTEAWIKTEYSDPLKYNAYNIKVQHLELLEEILKELKEAKKDSISK